MAKYIDGGAIKHLARLIREQMTDKIEQPTYKHVKCEYCESWIDATHINCPNCGAPVKRR